MSETSDEVMIPRRVLRAAARVAKFKILALMNETYARSGITDETLASRLGWSVVRVRRVLRGEGRITLRVVGEIFWAMDGAILQCRVQPHNEEPSN